jgi:rare lipoprotein A
MLERIITVATLSLTVWYSAPPPKIDAAAPVLPVPQFALASFYHEPQLIATGEQYDPWGYTAAHRSLPLGTRVKVTDAATGKSVTVVINDRGPATWTARDIDLSLAAAQALEMEQRGIILATLEFFPPTKPGEEVKAAARNNRRDSAQLAEGEMLVGGM